MSTINTAFIENLIADYETLNEHMIEVDLGVLQKITAHLTKLLVLACASCYEQGLQDAYVSYAERKSKEYADKPHGFDNYDKDKNVYQRFSFGRMDEPDDTSELKKVKNFLKPLNFFGNKFYDKILAEIEGDTEKEREVNAFHEIFVMRNLIAHKTFVDIPGGLIRNKTFNDIKELHHKAVKFASYLAGQF